MHIVRCRHIHWYIMHEYNMPWNQDDYKSSHACSLIHMDEMCTLLDVGIYIGTLCMNTICRRIKMITRAAMHVVLYV